MPSLRAALLAMLFTACTAGEIGGPGPGPGPGSGSGSDPGSGSGSDPGAGAPAGFVFSAYKDTTINLNWNTNVVTTMVPGSPTALASDLGAQHAGAITLAFATGECGGESWGGVPGATLASVNAPLFAAAGVKYIVSTGGAAGSFTCGSDDGFATFLDRWAGAGLVGVDFDIEAGQSPQVIADLVARLGAAHATHPSLRFSLTLATLADNDGAPAAHSLGAAAPDSLNSIGDTTLAAVASGLSWTSGDASSWPAYLTVDLMVMDYGAAGPGVCVDANGVCDMGQSALQAAHNLHDHWGVPFANIELTPMIGGNDNQAEQFTLADADTVAAFALAQPLAGVHYWSYDRDADCAPGYASPTCNSLGGVGAHGFLARFLTDGMP